MQASSERWSSVCNQLGLTAAADVGKRLINAYRRLGRHYHTLGHLDACLREFDTARDLAQRPAEVEMGLWFHDAVYRTYSKDNEERSADWARRFLAGHGGGGDVIARVVELILATKHAAEPAGADAKLLVDVDLSILGQSADVYAQFEGDVRREYWWVPAKTFAEKRAALLQGLLERPHLFSTERFRERYESQARVNVANAITTLRDGARA
ncbi:MAG: N-methyl-D-aspartate receptor NMDAR2C subunit [Burkholderiales bacterium]